MFWSSRKRLIQATVLLVVVLILVVSSLLTSSALTEKGMNYMDSLSLSIWLSDKANKFTHVDSLFNKKVNLLLKDKLTLDQEDRFWAIDTKLKPVQSDMQIPAYFFGSEENRPRLAPFDPRFTLAFYYNYLRYNVRGSNVVTVPFHWADWVDMSLLVDYIYRPDSKLADCSIFDNRPYQLEKFGENPDNHVKKGSMDPAQFCRLEGPDDNAKLGFVIERYFGRMTQDTSKVAGKAFLYTLAPNPTKLVFLTKDGSYQAYTSFEKSSLLENGIVDKFISENPKVDTINTMDQFHRLQSEHPAKKDLVMNDYEVHLKHEDFVFDSQKELNMLEDAFLQKTLSPLAVNYMYSLRQAIVKKSSPPKYFNEAKIFDTVLGDHYDWRFFNGLQIGSHEQAHTLHRLVRTWLSFTRKQGIVTWMAHGSLLSWYWNGIAFPWDNDIDVQMPIMDLHKLSKEYNQSLIIEDSDDGFGRYFLDSGTYIATREHNNGNNNIDARFIDIDSGLYIDITGLAVSNDKAPERYDEFLPSNYDKANHANEEINTELQVYNCRNKHFSSLSELSPLVKTFAEGEVAYVPKRYSDILTYEYKDKGLLQKFFSSRLFMPQLRLWIPQNVLKAFLLNRTQWVETYAEADQIGMTINTPTEDGNLSNGQIKSLLNLKNEELIDLLLDDDLLSDYLRTRELTAVHENEIMRLLFGKSTEKVVASAPDFEPLMYEPFLYRLNLKLTTFEQQVERYTRLEEQMTQSQEQTN